MEPPQLEVGAPLAWALSRAFSPLAPWRGPRPAPEEAWEVARGLDVACRIGWRVPRQWLVEEVGEGLAARFLAAYHDTAARAMLVQRVATEVVERLAAADLPCALLKSNALTLGGYTPTGARAFCDVDALVPAQRAGDARQVLLASGFRRGRERDGGHQLAPISHPSGVTVELHTFVKHMRAPGGSGWASLEELRGHNLLCPAGRGDMVFIPVPAFLAGHALVHGLVQHWRQVDDYPLARVVGDLQDIRQRWEGPEPLAEVVQPWLAAEGVEKEGAAALALAETLAATPGEDGAAIGALVGENLFLRHVVAVRYDAAYRDAVRAAGALWVDVNRSWTVAFARKVRNRLLLSAPSVERRYGTGRGAWRWLRARCLRPLELLGKLLWLLGRYACYRLGHLERRQVGVAHLEERGSTREG